jgi:hypothetical protein
MNVPSSPSAAQRSPVDPSAAARKVTVVTHGHCFDGLCSAVLFTRLLRTVHGSKPLAFRYRSATYGPKENGVQPEKLDGDINAILDYRFSPASQLTWYFDHHVSAFVTPADRARFDAMAASEKPSRYFHDGAYSSCTKLIVDVGAKYFDLDPEPTRELVRWADMIDSAAFPSAEMAVMRVEPELQLMSVIEHHGDDDLLAALVPRLLEEPLRAVAEDADVQTRYAPLGASHAAYVDLVRTHARAQGPVVFVDLLDQELEVAGKFVTYALYPESAYSVVVSRSRTKVKISVGFNPWCGQMRTHNIAQMCERHGGGGHPVVGAISFPLEEASRARTIAESLVAELQSPRERSI